MYDQQAFLPQALLLQLQELGLRAFGYGSTGMNKVFFTGDAPVISDDTIAKNPGDTVFPDTTTMIYYPKDNPTWNNYDFTKHILSSSCISLFQAN